jgi:hypothetical protein
MASPTIMRTSKGPLTRWGWRGLLLLVPLLAGCEARSAGVNGTITYDGSPVEDGFITFYPADGNGPTQGTAIVKGQYRLERLAPGKKRVLITSRPAGRKVSEGGKVWVQLTPPDHAVPRDAIGNNQVVDIPAGEQTLDFRLERPKR